MTIFGFILRVIAFLILLMGAICVILAGALTVLGPQIVVSALLIAIVAIIWFRNWPDELKTQKGKRAAE